MKDSHDLMIALAKEYHVPISDENVQVWFFRTQSGLYYTDFKINNYIALGWDLISKELITNLHIDKQMKKERISELYPDEQRPGLILGQIDTFFNKMVTGDIVVIPSSGGRVISIGILGEITTTVLHKEHDLEYEKCTYSHKRCVEWIKDVNLNSDVYLAKALRGQQTISNISQHANLIYRHLFPCYISKNHVHLMMLKTTSTDLSIQKNIKLQSSIIQINDDLCQIFDTTNESEKIKIKTAVSSPGFLEFLLPSSTCTIITVVLIIKTLIGKSKDEQGRTNNGVLALLTKINELINDHTNRKKTQAETKQIYANTEKIYAEKEQIYANIEKTRAETKSILNSLEHEQKRVAELKAHCDTLKYAADSSGIHIDNELDNVS